MHTYPLPSILALSGDEDMTMLPDLSIGNTLSEALFVGGVEGITCIFDSWSAPYLLHIAHDT